MARLTDTSSPDDAVAAPGASPHTAETLVREAHRSMTNTYLTTHAVNRFSFLHNPGVSTRTRNSTKRLRSEYLQEACQEWPHLLREVPGAAGRAAKFLRRSLDVDRMQEVITSVCAGHDAVTVADVFGAWDDWKWPEEQPGETSWDSLLQGRSLQSSQQISMAAKDTTHIWIPYAAYDISTFGMTSFRSNHKETKKKDRKKER